LPGKTRLRNDLLRVEWDVKPYSYSSLPHYSQIGLIAQADPLLITPCKYIYIFSNVSVG